MAGIPMQFGFWDKEKRAYRSTGGRQFAIFPGSGLFGNKKPEWLLAFELVETSRVWARKVARIDVRWIEELVPHMCRYHWWTDAAFSTAGCARRRRTRCLSGRPSWATD